VDTFKSLSRSRRKTDVVINTCNPSIQEAEANLGHIARPGIKKQNKKGWGEWLT
jgi:hypothetical protein